MTDVPPQQPGATQSFQGTAYETLTTWRDIVSDMLHYSAAALLTAGVGYFVIQGKLSQDILVQVIMGDIGLVGYKTLAK